MMPTDEERRSVAARLRAMTEGQSPMAEYPVEMLFIAFGMPMSWKIDGALIGYIADLIEPSCDREALLALAEEMEAEKNFVLVGGYARRIREAMGVGR